eukprot:2604133-Rhodomonas_salina.2
MVMRSRGLDVGPAALAWLGLGLTMPAQRDSQMLLEGMRRRRRSADERRVADDDHGPAEDDPGGGAEAQAAAEPVRGGAIGPQPLLEEPDRGAGRDRRDEAQV